MPTPKPLKLYTKTGDKGQSNALPGIRLSKDHELFEVLGTLDELNAHLGHAIVALEAKTKKELRPIQHNLLTCGALVAGSTKVVLDKKAIAQLEKRIDYYQEHTGKDWYTKFLLPGGTEAASRIDIARTVCRRLERRIIHLDTLEEQELYISEENLNLVRAYINRLSDYLFALRCHINAVAGYEEEEFDS